MENSIIIRRSWRSQILLVILLIFVIPVSIYITFKYPQTIITGRFITIFGKDIYLSLPLLWFIPSGILGYSLWQIYNVRYCLDSKGIETRNGILGTSQRISRIRYEDIRSTDVVQSVPDRFLNIGKIAIGTAATSGIEIEISYVTAPYEIERMIEIERDKRQNI